MTKYILVETYSAKESNPHWFEWVDNLEPRHIQTKRYNVLKFADGASLSNYLAKNYSATSRYEVFEVSREVVPVLETKTTVTFK